MRLERARASQWEEQQAPKDLDLPWRAMGSRERKVLGQRGQRSALGMFTDLGFFIGSCSPLPAHSGGTHCRKRFIHMQHVPHNLRQGL